MRWWGIGDAYLCGPQDGAKPIMLDDGYEMVVLKDFDPRPLAINQRWCPTTVVADLHARVWVVPMVLSQHGDRKFSTAYGGDFLPLLTPVQDKCEKVAHAARSALIAAANGEQAVPMSMAARWAAELISAVNHVTPQVLAFAGLLDDALIGGTLYQATGLAPRLEVSDG